MPTLTLSAAMIEPTAVTATMATMILRRPTRSPQRGRMRENSAAAVKKAVWVSPIRAVVVPSSCSMVASTGESIDALSWKAKIAKRRARIRPAVLDDFLIEVTMRVSFVGIGVVGDW